MWGYLVGLWLCRTITKFRSNKKLVVIIGWLMVLSRENRDEDGLCVQGTAKA